MSKFNFMLFHVRISTKLMNFVTHIIAGYRILQRQVAKVFRTFENLEHVPAIDVEFLLLFSLNVENFSTQRKFFFYFVFYEFKKH